VLRIRIGLDPDPAFQVNADLVPVQDFIEQKLKKNKITSEQRQVFFDQKFAIYLYLGRHKGRPSYRRSFQPS
jgi:hypothetical protein